MSSKAEFHVTVKGIILNEGKMLILKKTRPSKDAHGFWELPGGGMEYNETPIQAMKREALEETGLQIDVIKPVSTFHVARKAKQIIGIIFLCQAKDSFVQLSEEHTTYRFITQDEAKNYLDDTIIKDTFNNGELRF